MVQNTLKIIIKDINELKIKNEAESIRLDCKEIKELGGDPVEDYINSIVY